MEVAARGTSKPSGLHYNPMGQEACRTDEDGGVTYWGSKDAVNVDRQPKRLYSALRPG